jgi:hypothetical protein
MAALYQTRHFMYKTTKNYRELCNRIDWFRLFFTGGLPLLAFITGVFRVPLKLPTAIFAFVYGSCSGIGITAGKTLQWLFILLVRH